MGKRARDRNRAAHQPADGQEVGPRQPCPCGSGRRYRNCHGGSTPVAAFVARPFAGLPGECDVVAMREFVPAATAPLRLRGDDRSVLLATLLPGAAPALVREDGSIWLGLQVQHSYGDPARDLGAVLEMALTAPTGSMVGLTEAPGDGPRLQDLIEQDTLEVSVHDGFDFWIGDVADDDGSLAAVLEQANGAAAPTRRMPGAEAAYWTSVGDREFLRWVMPHDEDALLDALARLHHAGADRLVEPARLIGMFRASGLLAPVWELPEGTGHEVLEEPVVAFAAAVAEALEGDALTPEERATRAGLASRQLTLR